MEEEIKEEIVRSVADSYDLDREELVKFLYDLGELYDLELLTELGKILDN